MDVPFWIIVDEATRGWLAERAWRELPPQERVLAAGRLWSDFEAAGDSATSAATALRTMTALVRVCVPVALARRADFAACVPPTPAQWRELAMNLLPPLELVYLFPPSPRESRLVDWTQVRGLDGSDTIASAELVRAPVDAVADALAGGARSVVRDVFGKRVPFAPRHRLVFRLRGHAWTCLVTCRRSFLTAPFDASALSQRLVAPVLACWISDCSGEASICGMENGVTERCDQGAPPDGTPLRVRFRGREFTGYDTYALMDPILRSEDAWWNPYLWVERFLVDPIWEEPADGAELQFARSLRCEDEELPVEATAWITW